MFKSLFRFGIYTVLIIQVSSCDHGLVPPDAPATGTIRAAVTYVGTWPAETELHDLRFVAMRFVPRDTADFLQLNRMAISNRLEYNVSAQEIVVPNVETGVFLYTGIAQQFASDLLSWRPVGLYTENEGAFFVTTEDTVDLSIVVDFASPPPFPPPSL